MLSFVIVGQGQDSTSCLQKFTSFASTEAQTSEFPVSPAAQGVSWLPCKLLITSFFPCPHAAHHNVETISNHCFPLIYRSTFAYVCFLSKWSNWEWAGSITFRTVLSVQHYANTYPWKAADNGLQHWVPATDIEDSDGVLISDFRPASHWLLQASGE